MANFDVKALGKDLLDVLKVKLADHFTEAKPFAELSMKQLAQNLEMITELKLTNVINEQQAKLHLDIFKSSVRITLLTIEGLGILAVEDAINAALDAIKNIVNTTIGFPLI
jgi:hypothetical protein